MSLSENSNWESDSTAKLDAQKIAFGPFVFQTAKVARDTGLLQLLNDVNDKGIELKEIIQKLNLSEYSVKVILDASEDINLVKNNNNKYTLTKTGFFLLNDTITKINMDFVHDVCYNGMFYLDEAVKNNIPAGLKVFGEWNTLYEALSSLPEQAKKSWFNFDHYFSDRVFTKALNVIFRKSPKKLLDVGGNTGKWAIQCAKFSNDVNITIMDLPQQIKTAKGNISQYDFKDRVSYHPTDLLNKENTFPTGFDAIWMSQFLDCFSEDQIVSILSRAKKALNNDARIYILETFTDRQNFKTAKFCLDMTSLYFTCMANGNSKMYQADEMIKCIESAGLVVDQDMPIGISHTLLICKIK